MPNAKKTLIPHVPDSLTYTFGTTVGVGVSTGSAELIADKIFHRSVIDKIRYGITARGLVDYFKTPGNLEFVTKKVGDDNICLLQVKLSEGKCAYINAYSTNQGRTWSRKIIWKAELQQVDVKNLEGGHGGLSTGLVANGVVNYDAACVLSIGGMPAVVYRYAYGLTDLLYGINSDGVKGTMFEGLKFSDKDIGYIESEMAPYIDILLKDFARGIDLKFMNFEYKQNNQ